MTPCLQTDSRWKDKFIGIAVDQYGKRLTMGGYGCYVTAVACGLKNFYQKDIDPGRLVDWLNLNMGFDGEGQLQWEALKRLYPDTELVLTGQTVLAGGNIQVPKAINDIQENVASGMVVGILIPMGDKVRHFVLGMETPETGDWTVMDPLRGIINFQSVYGDPAKKIYGYRVFAGQPTVFPSYSDQDDKTYGIAISRCVDSRYSKRDVLNVLISG